MKRKQYKQKTHYGMMDLLMASPTEPLPTVKQIYQLDNFREGLNNLERSPNPTPDDWRKVADPINMLESLIDMGCIDDIEGLLKDATKAMGEAGARSLKTGVLRLSGLGMQACRAVIDDYAACMAQLPERTMVQAYINTEKRIQAMRAGKSRANDVEVVSL